MAYTIHIYARDDSNIDYTSAEILNTGEKSFYYSGDSDDGNPWFLNRIYNVTGSAIIYAFPFHGYKFSRFVYRVGSEDAEEQYWYDSEFVYDEGQNLYIRAEATRITVTEFDWYSSNGSATASQTVKALTALVNTSDTIDFSHRVWNDIVNKLYEVIATKGYIWDPQYATLSKTKMTSTDRILTAKRFNSFAYNLIGYGLDSWTPVSSGDPVIGLIIIMLVEKMNGYIREYHQ